MSLQSQKPSDTLPAYPDHLSIERAARILGVIGNPVRLAALVRLIEREWAVTELAAELRVSQSVMSQHLAKLRDAKCAKVRRHHQTMNYRCDNQTVINVVAELGLLPDREPQNSRMLTDGQ